MDAHSGCASSDWMSAKERKGVVVSLLVSRSDIAYLDDSRATDTKDHMRLE